MFNKKFCSFTNVTVSLLDVHNSSKLNFESR
ncbi:hypothetical protein KL86PLE_40257 [uncultured Pleomorphomonas sp.]|uniref:Uncharacterized protein n=1 Tax=uncultured Pleomorphomonas sp. TaxID=442121 RepID=A0A212LFW1_9HYPH|nr:hypothetical protein KL86PLE_40257 [uncultured Pleomorphomonas sp.]